MTTSTFPTFTEEVERLIGTIPAWEEQSKSKHDVDERVASAVRDGLSSRPKHLPAWLFYDKTGSRLFDEITERPEYYLTRTERAVLSEHAQSIVERAANGSRLRITELGAGSASKTRVILKAAVAQQKLVTYEPVDVCASALEEAKAGIEAEIPEVQVRPRVMDYTVEPRQNFARRLRSSTRQAVRAIEFEQPEDGERRLVLYIGSSIGNFEPQEASRLLGRLRAGLRPGDCLLLGVDLVKDEATLLAAYDDFAGVTADFNLNLLTRLNRELDAEFNLDSFTHRAVWNPRESRIEMHLESRIAQKVSIAAIDSNVEFAQGETIHTENSYKYRPGQIEAMLAKAGFETTQAWTDERGWFSVSLAQAR